jgi:hypothetical protein
MTITIDLTNTAAEALQAIHTRLADSGNIHAAMAGSAERFIKNFGTEAASARHGSANRLGAKPTGHLTKAYQDIEAQSDASSARLLVPRASRLRAAFGGYTVRPGAGKTYLTIPVAAEAYGKRAGEIQGLEFMRVGPKKTPILARPDGNGRITTFYLLAKEADIPADEGLIPFDDMTAQAADAAELYILGGDES